MQVCSLTDYYILQRRKLAIKAADMILPMTTKKDDGQPLKQSGKHSIV